MLSNNTFFSSFESSLFVPVFDTALESIDFLFDDFYHSILWINNNTFNVFLIAFLIPFFTIYLYTNKLNNSFFFKFILSPCYKITYGWTNSYVPYCKFFVYPFIVYLFLFLLCSNLIGMVPFNFAITSHLSFTFLLSFTVWFTTVVLCFYYQGFHFLDHFLIKGIPNLLVPALLVIELLSYCIRAISLSLRLFANIFSGHILLHVISSGLYELAFSYSTGFLLSSTLAFSLTLCFFSVLVIFEVLVGLLQAYIFTLLSLIYLSDV